MKSDQRVVGRFVFAERSAMTSSLVKSHPRSLWKIGKKLEY